MESATTMNDADEMVFFNEENSWRVAKADKLSLIVDGEDYFRHLRAVISAARLELLLVGWDFDFEIEMLPGESDADGKAPDGLPNKLGPFLEAVIEQTPELHIYLLKWNGAVLVAPGRLLPALALDVFGSDRIHMALDSHHPFGACHHHKIVAADNTFAFCGGIDATESRWDTSEHLPKDPRRVLKDGSPASPWHDATSALTGPVATALAELSRRRWHRATGEKLVEPERAASAIWPKDLNIDAANVDVAIARTGPPFDGEPLINEIEMLFLDSIAVATDSIYFESQYFVAETICSALEDRLRQVGGPEVVVINPQFALSDFEDDAMHVLRDRVIERLCAADHEDRFRIYYPVTSAGEQIYVHAKINIVDDQILHLGSSNINDRSMGFDTECDVAVEGTPKLIMSFRTRLLAEHLAVSVERFDQVFSEKRSLISTIETLNAPEGRGLRKIEARTEGLRGAFLANTRMMDQRYTSGQSTSTGQGVRPRHFALIAGAVAIGFIGWKAWRRVNDEGR